MAPFAVLALAMASTVLAWQAIDRAEGQRVDLRFEQEVRTTAAAITDRMLDYELMLRGGAGLFFASEEVTRDEFRIYVDILQVQENLPGIQGFGFVGLVPAEQRAWHEAQVRNEGLSDYRVHPAGDRVLLAPVVFIEPFDARNARVLGFDTFSDPVRRVAADRARDTARAAISGKVTLIQDQEGGNADLDAPAGFLMFLPIYRSGIDPGDPASRRDALEGFVYAPFRARDLIDGIRQDDSPSLRFDLFDGATESPEHRLYDGLSDLPLAGRRQARVAMEVGGRQWTALFAATPDLERGDGHSTALIVLVAGCIISLILFGITLLMNRLLSERRQAAETLLQAERKLHQAQKMETVGQLTGGVAHDFNNLLTVVLGNAEILVEELAGNERLQRIAGTTLAAAERGAQLTSRLLAFSRRQVLTPQPTDIAALLEDMEKLFRRALGEQVEYRTRCVPDLWPALVDGSQLESALLNLCVNARDAMPGGGRLTIAATNAVVKRPPAGSHGEAAPGRYVAIAVSDTGSGMVEEVQARAFDPFFTTKAVGQGSGLGLSMVYGFAQQSKGLVRIDSAPGQGTTITLWLPATETVQAEEAIGTVP